jgi:hypothetical protein
MSGGLTSPARRSSRRTRRPRPTESIRAGAAVGAADRGDTYRILTDLAQQLRRIVLCQASAHLDDAAADPHDTLRRAALESAAEHICSAEKLLCALADVLDPGQLQAAVSLSTLHLRQLLQRDHHAGAADPQ